MPYIITEPCIDVMDGACRDVCPVNCIYLPEETVLPAGQQQRKMYVNPAECIECDACHEVCPADAIHREEQVPKRWQAYIAAEYAAFAWGQNKQNKDKKDSVNLPCLAGLHYPGEESS